LGIDLVSGQSRWNRALHMVRFDWCELEVAEQGKALEATMSNFSAVTTAFWEKELADGGWYNKSAQYWKDNCPPTVDGVLGGFASVDPVDVRESTKFLEDVAKLRADMGCAMRRNRALDGGAGIGRVTKNLLGNFFDTVDLLEGNQRLLEAAPDFLAEKRSHLGEMFCSTLQDFVPKEGVYDCIWVQWCVIYLTDLDFIRFLKHCANGLHPGGLIFIKENVLDKDSTHDLVKDEDDSSVTRSLTLMEHIFEQAGLAVVLKRYQEEWSDSMLPVMMYALIPQAHAPIPAEPPSNFQIAS